MKTIVYSTHGFDRPYMEHSAGGRHELIFHTDKLGVETAELAQGAEAVALFTSDNASAPVLERLHEAGIKYVCLRSAGYDHVDLEKARQLGMRVANVPAYSPYSVAEHGATLLMALNRQVVLSQNLINI